MQIKPTFLHDESPTFNFLNNSLQVKNRFEQNLRLDLQL